MKESVQEFRGRQSQQEVDPLFVRRWSTRQYRSDPVPDRDLALMLEAARWSPSAYNEQPWRFYTSTAESHQAFLALLVEANQKWAASAPVIGFVVTSKRFARNGKENMHADFDTGAAWLAFNLQASKMGYSVHGMAGIHYEEAFKMLGLDPDRDRLVCGFTVGVSEDTSESLTDRQAVDAFWTQV